MVWQSVVLCILVYMTVLNYMSPIEGTTAFMHYNVDMHTCIEVIMVSLIHGSLVNSADDIVSHDICVVYCLYMHIL